MAKIFKFKNKRLFAFGETAKTLPSAETLMKKVKKRGPKTAPVPVLKTLQNIKKCRKQTPLGWYGFPKMFLSVARNTSRLNFYKRDEVPVFRFWDKMEISPVKKESRFQSINSKKPLKNDVLQIYAVKTFTRLENGPIKMMNSEIGLILMIWIKRNRRTLNSLIVAI